MASLFKKAHSKASQVKEEPIVNEWLETQNRLNKEAEEHINQLELDTRQREKESLDAAIHNIFAKPGEEIASGDRRLKENKIGQFITGNTADAAIDVVATPVLKALTEPALKAVAKPTVYKKFIQHSDKLNKKLGEEGTELLRKYAAGEITGEEWFDKFYKLAKDANINFYDEGKLIPSGKKELDPMMLDEYINELIDKVTEPNIDRVNAQLEEMRNALPGYINIADDISFGNSIRRALYNAARVTLPGDTRRHIAASGKLAKEMLESDAIKQMFKKYGYSDEDIFKLMKNIDKNMKSHDAYKTFIGPNKVDTSESFWDTGNFWKKDIINQHEPKGQELILELFKEHPKADIIPGAKGETLSGLNYYHNLGNSIDKTDSVLYKFAALVDQLSTGEILRDYQKKDIQKYYNTNIPEWTMENVKKIMNSMGDIVDETGKVIKKGTLSKKDITDVEAYIKNSIDAFYRKPILGKNGKPVLDNKGKPFTKGILRKTSVLDENGNPIVKEEILNERPIAPKDTLNKKIILDENGNPILDEKPIYGALKRTYSPLTNYYKNENLKELKKIQKLAESIENISIPTDAGTKLVEEASKRMFDNINNTATDSSKKVSKLRSEVYNAWEEAFGNGYKNYDKNDIKLKGALLDMFHLDPSTADAKVYLYDEEDTLKRLNEFNDLYKLSSETPEKKKAVQTLVDNWKYLSDADKARFLNYIKEDTYEWRKTDEYQPKR